MTADELPHDGAFVATHVQKDEIERTKDPKRRSDLLKKFSETIDDMIPTSSFVLDVSRLDHAMLGNGVTYEAIKTKLDAANGQKPNNVQDALIAEVASTAGHVLVTADRDLQNVCQRLGIGVYYFAVGEIPAN